MNEYGLYALRSNLPEVYPLTSLDVHKQFFLIEELLDLIDAGVLELLDNGRKGWSLEEKSAFLQTLMLGQNTSDLIIDNSDIQNRLVIDGQEWLKTIYDYCRKGFIPHLSFPLIVGVNDYRFMELPLVVRRQFLNRKLAALTLNFGADTISRYNSLSNLMLLKGASELWSLVEHLYPEKYHELERGAEKLRKSYSYVYKGIRRYQELLLVASVLSGAPIDDFKTIEKEWHFVNLSAFMGYLVSCPNYDRDFETIADSHDFHYLNYVETDRVFKQKEYQKRFLLYLLIESGIWRFEDASQFSQFLDRFELLWRLLGKKLKSPTIYNFFANYVYFTNELRKV